MEPAAVVRSVKSGSEQCPLRVAWSRVSSHWISFIYLAQLSPSTDFKHEYQTFLTMQREEKMIFVEARANHRLSLIWISFISSLKGRAEAIPSDPMFKISYSPWSMIMRRVHTVTSINNSVLSNINCWWLTSSWSSNIFNRDRNVLSNNTSKSKLDLISSANDLNHETWRRKVQFITRHILQSPVSINPTCHEYHTPHPPPYLDLTVVRRKLQPQSGLSPLIVACTCPSSISVCMIAR